MAVEKSSLSVSIFFLLCGKRTCLGVVVYGFEKSIKTEKTTYLASNISDGCLETN